MSQVNVHLVRFAAAPVEQCAGPERIGAVRQARRGGKVGLPPAFMDCHAGGHFAQLLEFRDPEIFIQVQVAVVALCGACVSAEEIERCAVGQHHRIAFQLHIHLFCKVDDVLLENVRLGLTGGKENLVSPGGDGVNQGLTGKKEGRANLAGLEKVTDAVTVARLPPVALIGEHRAVENLLQLFGLLVAEYVLFRWLARAFVAVRHVGVKVGLVAAVVKFTDAGMTF